MSMKTFGLPCPLSYQQEGLWLLELVQDMEVVCTCPRQNDKSEVCWRSHLKNSLVLLLRDPHHLDENPWGCRCTWWSRTWRSLGNPLDQGLGSFFKCINLLLKLILPFLLVVLWWKIILSLCPFERSRIILLLLRNKLRLGVWSSSHSTPLALNFRSKPTPWFFRRLPCLCTISSNCLLPARLL